MLKIIKYIFEQTFYPKPVLSVSEWANVYRIMSRSESGYPGLWRSSLTPYLDEPMDMLSHPTVQKVILVFAAQLGKTEVGLNWIGWIISQQPGPVMILRPTILDCEGFTHQRLKHLFEVPRLKPLVASYRTKEEAANVILREFTGGIIILSGANSPTRLAAWPIRYLFADEVDRYPESAGAEGSPLRLAEKRLSSFGPRAKELITSTPTIKGKSILEKDWVLSSQAHWEMPCPHCGFFQELVWLDNHGQYRIKWDGDPYSDTVVVWYECINCKKEIFERHKPDMLMQGRWVHAFPDRAIKGYTLNALAAPIGWVSWRTLVREWVQAIERQKAGDVSDLQVFINTRLAQWWEDIGNHTIEADQLEIRLEKWDKLPERVIVITAGVDVQEDRLECEVVAWGPGMESWGVDYHVIPIDPLDAGAWELLDEALSKTYETEDGRHLPISIVCIDSGFRPQQVLEYVLKHQKSTPRRFAIKGIPGTNKPIWDRKPRRGLAKSTRAGIFYAVGVDTAKDTIASQLQIKVSGPGYMHFHEDYLKKIPDYFKQLTSEKRIRQKDKRTNLVKYRWVQVSEKRRNECLDCRVYALAALHAWLIAGNSLKLQKKEEKSEEQHQQQQQKTQQTQILQQPQKREPLNLYWQGLKRNQWFKS